MAIAESRRWYESDDKVYEPTHDLRKYRYTYTLMTRMRKRENKSVDDISPRRTIYQQSQKPGV